MFNKFVLKYRQYPSNGWQSVPCGWWNPSQQRFIPYAQFLCVALTWHQKSRVCSHTLLISVIVFNYTISCGLTFLAPSGILISMKIRLDNVGVEVYRVGQLAKAERLFFISAHVFNCHNYTKSKIRLQALYKNCVNNSLLCRTTKKRRGGFRRSAAYLCRHVVKYVKNILYRIRLFFFGIIRAVKPYQSAD